MLELQSLSRQLEPLAQLPPCDPLLRGCAAFDAMAARLAEAQALRAGALARALAGLELGLLECKLRLREGARAGRPGWLGCERSGGQRV